jgi:type I restriction enzyme S subunit
MSEWKEQELSELAELRKDSWKVGDEQLPYIALEHIVENGLRLEGIGNSSIVASNKYYFDSQNFLFGKLRPYFRKLYRPNFKGICSTDIWVVKPKDGNDKDFLFYFFANKEFIDYSYSGSSGTRMPRADWNFVSKTKWRFPEPIEQRAISSILSSLDDKIDLLHRQNQTLEQMAETLYDAWFEESDFTSRVSDLIDLQNGYAFKSKSFQDFGEDRVLKIKNISGGIVDIETTDFVSHETVENLDGKFSISTGDILFAMTGAKIGKMGIIPKTDYQLWLNQRVGLFKEKYYGSRFLAYLHLKSDYGKDYIENTATGSAQPNISGTGIENCEFPEITEQEIIDYSNQIAPLYGKVIFNLGQVQKLEALRNTLLPKLMSGEIRLIYDSDDFGDSHDYRNHRNQMNHTNHSSDK